MRRHFGISAREALTELPEWEIDVLLGELDRERRDLNRQRAKED